MDQRDIGIVHQPRRSALLSFTLLLVYVAAGKFSLSLFGLIHPSASAVWLPTGIAIGALLLVGRRMWPVIFVGAFIVNITTEGSILTSLGVAGGNTLEGVIAAELVRRFAGGRHVFHRAADVLRFACLAALLSTTVSATIGVASLTLGGYAAPSQFAGIWFTWWLGDASGAMLVTPLVLLWTPQARRESASDGSMVLLLYTAVAAAGAITFFHPVVASYPLAFLCLAPLVWGALRFGPREVATAVALLSAIALAATAVGHGSFVMPTANESLLVLQAFMGLLAVTALPMAALTVERRHLLERERAARAEADAASRAKDEFLAILSHELRNPLAAITAAAEALEAGQRAIPEAQPGIGVIRRQTRHLARLLDDLFDIGRVAARRMKLLKEPLDLAGAVEGCVRELERAGLVSSGRIELDLRPAWVHGDPDRIEQIVNNLVGNAIRYTSPGRCIRVTVRPHEVTAVLRVEDEGAGIGPELLPHVFEAFRQGEQGPDRNPGGLGIGLTLVRRLVALHDGSVEALSAGPGQGSAFVVRLPLLEAPGILPPARAADTRIAAGRPVPACRLLIVEDNEDARQGLRSLLELGGHEVHEAADGEAGVSAAIRIAPDLAFIDIGLPALDGYEVARRIKAANPGIRLVALTGYGNEGDRQRARDAGFDSHLLKPATLHDLQQAVASAIDRPRGGTEPELPNLAEGTG